MPFSIKHALARKHYARAAKLLLKQTEDKNAKASDQQLVEVRKTHWVSIMRPITGN
jgi:hypothetical protein